MELPRIEARGLFVVCDPHVAASPPGHRLEGYREQVLAKLSACLDRARELECHPVIPGDLFHWPRENPNSLLVELIELFRPQRPTVLPGNHDKYLARFTPDVSLAVLAAAGAVRLADRPGPAFRLETPSGSVLVGASPDGTPLPRHVERAGAVETVWFSHHSVGFPDFQEGLVAPRPIEGLDWLINGHIHRPQPMVVKGGTRWCNPGNVTRLTFTARTRERVPSAWVWRPGAGELERWPVPMRPFAEVFPDQPFPAEPTAEESRSLFLKGLERLALRRTQEGLGLKDFLDANLNPEDPGTGLIWELYEEVAGGEKRPRRS
ncbi:3',5'-cyclic adenosine monophosphate phosphodiesterase CpdA [Fundidesulfovibrio magnetotacticus]|uniref:3',5'-cyclic adenosine monophosphate phosphodiesterase CpdA n=1 Tax=Fundidesulfovibrio magnetotacticus TaxID=2730080 RepID=A0A6V8LSP7_9BACT|nr:metallophosphoesterase [Fundidesulfovibrio magnetotacticus]GFK93109.1 3',5'-cyclic adenosine monophosphate phosphodiesterase CpdA [Fundidesulfovibrio magnetotacticus]